MVILKISLIILLVFGVLELCHILSYGILKKRILKRQRWDLNICSGKTDGGGVNADIFQHLDVRNFVKVDDIYNLPFKDKQFETVLCSHTIEHVDDPEAFYHELSRVGEQVILVIPPLWDPLAVLNFLEHQWIFLSFKKEHTRLPGYVRLPLAKRFQRRFGQRIHA